MADIKKLAPFILKWEGKFVDDPKDRGGATNMGVTISTWRQVGYDKDGDGDIDVDDLKLLIPEDVVKRVLKPYYWDRCKADLITNQSIANTIVDWVWSSGKWGIVIPQRILGLIDDGIVGTKTISALNNSNQANLFNAIKKERIRFVMSICKNDSTQNRFLEGWLKRINDLKFA